MLSSKIYESYVLDWTKTEVSLRSNQYGGVKGVSTDHVLVQMWQGILQDLEDYRASTIITSVDYSKAFNRMSYQHCLAALVRNGASTDILRLIATFLTNRIMVRSSRGPGRYPEVVCKDRSLGFFSLTPQLTIWRKDVKTWKKREGVNERRELQRTMKDQPSVIRTTRRLLTPRWQSYQLLSDESLARTRPTLRDCSQFSACTEVSTCLLYTSPSPRDRQKSRMPSSA